jgi:hypothetical protein
MSTHKFRNLALCQSCLPANKLFLISTKSTMALNNNFIRDLMGQMDVYHVSIVPDNATTPSSELLQQTCCTRGSRKSVNISRSFNMSEVLSVEHAPETIVTTSQRRWDDMFFNQSDPTFMMPASRDRWGVSRYSCDSVLLKKPTRTSCMPIAEPILHTVLERKYPPTSLINSEKQSPSSRFGFGAPSVTTETLGGGETMLSSNASQESQHAPPASLELLPSSMASANCEQPIHVRTEKVKPRRFLSAGFISTCVGALGQVLVFASAFVLVSEVVVGPAFLTPASQLFRTISSLSFLTIAPAPEKNQEDFLRLYRVDRDSCICLEDQVALLDISTSTKPPRGPQVIVLVNARLA